MRASRIEFRMRLAIIALIVVLGFWAPWIERWGLDRISLLEWSSLELSRLGLFNFTVATPVVILIATAVAALGAVLRVWGTAWLGASVVNNSDMTAGTVMASGPYRYVRNPLYLGTQLTMTGMSSAMPVSGAAFAILFIAVFQLRLILGEEAYLTGHLGESYARYRRSVPRLFPRLRSNLPYAQGDPQWMRAILAEIFPIGVFLILAVLSWRFENQLLTKAFLICFGVSLVARALMPRKPEAASVAP
ncbi:isoprenylcysteine carboxylmethyltransferase family protein [Acidobacteria bacterium AB60]|nr:isoprenylcysteine carboxylmethyltransferase family protein [Acidobacteria bacterium AB60]